MAKIFKHQNNARDEYIGRINAENGRVYSERLGPDKYIASVNYEKGEVHREKFGPDEYIGRVNDDRKIYAHKVGPDDYVARVEKDGKLYSHVALGRDVYVGRVDDMRHPVEAAAAWFLFFADDEVPEAESAAKDSEAADA